MFGWLLASSFVSGLMFVDAALEEVFFRNHVRCGVATIAIGASGPSHAIPVANCLEWRCGKKNLQLEGLLHVFNECMGRKAL